MVSNDSNTRIVTVPNVASWIILGLCAAVCFGYFIVGPHFAEVHIRLPWLPVFVGEICLIISSLIVWFYFVRLRLWKQYTLKTRILWGLVLVFLSAKIIEGYLSSGVYAFRNSALFYYAFFAFYIYTVHPRSIPEWLKAGLLIGLFCVIFTGDFVIALFTVVALCMLVLIRSLQWRSLKILFLGAYIFLPFRLTILYSRAFLIANVVTLVFLSVALIAMRVWSRSVKIAVAVGALIAIGLLIFFKADPHSIQSIVDVRPAVKQYRYTKEYLQLAMKDRPMEPLRTELYRPGVSRNKPKPVETLDSRCADCVAEDSVQGSRDEPARVTSSSVSCPDECEVSEDTRLQLLIKKRRDIPTARTTMLFRIFIWEDILSQLWQSKALLGFSFGKPIRSPQVETLKWGYDAWHSVGFICAHNSFLAMLFYGGIISLLGIGWLIRWISVMIASFIRWRDLNGVLLSAGVVNMMVMAFFAVVFELPYYAIPFWCLIGIMAAYYRYMCKQHIPA